MTLTCSSLLRHATWLAACLVAVLAAGCAQTPTPFTPPAERPSPVAERPWPPNHYLALAYHAIHDQDVNQEYLTVRTDQLVSHLQWLKHNGYQPVSVDQILKAQQGGPALPARAVLLSFDDGYSDFYTRVMPILRAFQWPAVLAPVGTWVDTPDNQSVQFGDIQAPRGYFLTPRQLREIAQSPLIEIGAHTYNHHFGAQANPQGNLLPALANQLYKVQEGRYETTEEYRARVAQDAKEISERLQALSGRKPRVWVWPYGAASGTAIDVLKAQGYELFLTLQDGVASVNDPLNVPRILLSGQASLNVSATMMATARDQKRETRRVAHVDLDYVYDPDPAQAARNLDKLVQRIADLRINTVFLQAYSDPQGDGLVREVYFPNSVLPMRADLFNRVAWQLRSRAGVRIFAWMPVLSLDLDASHPRVQRLNPETGALEVDAAQYQRLSPFDARNRADITRLYTDLSRHAAFDGLLFHDDALLSDYEDASAPALQAYARAGLPTDLRALRADPALMERWSRFKSKALVDFTLELTQAVRAVRGPQVQTARNLFAQPILQPQSEQWFAQNLDDFLSAYDWTAPMAMPLMENVPADQAQAWLHQLVAEVARRPGALDKTIFEIQARDWRQDDAGALIDSTVLAGWMRGLQLHGARHIGYYPDDFTQDHPALEVIRPQLSNAWSPTP